MCPPPTFSGCSMTVPTWLASRCRACRLAPPAWMWATVVMTYEVLSFDRHGDSETFASYPQ